MEIPGDAGSIPATSTTFSCLSTGGISRDGLGFGLQFGGLASRVRTRPRPKHHRQAAEMDRAIAADALRQASES